MGKIGIYVHIPFCKKKCSYCDFVSFDNKQNCIDKYIKCLENEITSKSKLLYKEKNDLANNYIIDTIYIGGGTPSFIDEKYINDILTTIKQNFTIDTNCEITIEINPGTVTENKLDVYKKLGINRISIGLQSTNNKLLKQIGRIHTYEDFLDTYRLALSKGFNNINVDLILALPGQTIEILKDSVNKIIALNPKHISVYSLILEDGTVMKEEYDNNRIVLPSDDLERKMYWMVKNKLEQNGFVHYEISNFSKEGYKSKHNLNCWNQHEYLGFGLAAHSYFDKKRYCNTDNLNEYIKYINGLNSINVLNSMDDRNGIEILEIQNIEDTEKEFMLLGLRISEFKNKFGENPIYVFKDQFDKLVNKKLIEIDLDSIKLTNKGLDLANKVWEEFI